MDPGFLVFCTYSVVLVLFGLAFGLFAAVPPQALVGHC